MDKQIIADMIEDLIRITGGTDENNLATFIGETTRKIMDSEKELVDKYIGAVVFFNRSIRQLEDALGIYLMSAVIYGDKNPKMYQALSTVMSLLDQVIEENKDTRSAPSLDHLKDSIRILKDAIHYEKNIPRDDLEALDKLGDEILELIELIEDTRNTINNALSQIRAKYGAGETLAFEIGITSTLIKMGEL